MSGINNDKLFEPLPNFVEAPCESIIKGDNNAYIVLGRDRPAGLDSGYGGKGDTQAGSIDVVVGRTSWLPKGYDKEGDEIWTNPSFKYDACRIHLSQKTDIDDNFNLSDGKIGKSKAKSGIGIKADAVRVVAREGIKLVTGMDKQNSAGGKSVGNYGVDIIAMNDDSDLQPLVKGDNLVQALNDLTTIMGQILGELESFMVNQNIINTSISTHTHFSNAPGSPTSPSVEMAPVAINGILNTIQQSYTSVLATKANLGLAKLNYLTPMAELYINSSYNNTN